MSSIDALLDDLDAAVEAVAAVNSDICDPVHRYRVLDRLETARRRLIAVSHDQVARLQHVEGCPPVPVALADVLRISRAEARRRVRDAEQLKARTSLTGEALPPLLPAAAEAWDAGLLDGEHLRVIQKFVRELPGHLTPIEVADAESALAGHAENLRPDQLEKVADRLALTLNPDGRFSDEDRARKRGFTWSGGQRPDGMSTGRLVATPELRAMIDAWLAKFAAPGMCNPDDESPCIGGEPTDEVTGRDFRSHGQRQHDALVALVRSQLGNPELGTHRGLPVTVIATASVQQLQDRAGHAVTASGTLLPISDLIRMAGHAYHYLSLFDGIDGRPLFLGRTKRIATADQRIVLHGKDRGCTAPGCTAPGYLCEVHHVEDWAGGGLSNIDNLTFACAPHHKLLEQGWTTRKLPTGDTQWIPPPQLPLLSPGTNDFHHPEKLIGDQGDEAA